eukprot:scaffold2850_cov235-Pinguiococcus_pyrenoidosus.AAC.18
MTPSATPGKRRSHRRRPSTPPAPVESPAHPTDTAEPKPPGGSARLRHLGRRSRRPQRCRRPSPAGSRRRFQRKASRSRPARWGPGLPGSGDSAHQHHKAWGAC